MEPKNEKYIFGKRDSIHLATQTLDLTKIALEKIFKTIENNGKFYLFQQKNKHQSYCRSC